MLRLVSQPLVASPSQLPKWGRQLRLQSLPQRPSIALQQVAPQMLAVLFATYTQSPDHPIIPMIPETEYLKGFAFEVVR